MYPISDSYSNTNQPWIYSIHTGQRYQNCLHFRPNSYWSNLSTQPASKICAQTFMDCWIFTKSYVKGMPSVYMEREYLSMATKNSTWYFGSQKVTVFNRQRLYIQVFDVLNMYNIYICHWILISILYQGTVWLSCYPLHVHMGWRKSISAIFNGQYHKHLTILSFTTEMLILFVYNVQDGYELRKMILGQLLTFKENEYEDIPSGVKDFINCIRKTKDNMSVKTWGSKANKDQ